MKKFCKFFDLEVAWTPDISLENADRLRAYWQNRVNSLEGCLPCVAIHLWTAQATVDVLTLMHAPTSERDVAVCRLIFFIRTWGPTTGSRELRPQQMAAVWGEMAEFSMGTKQEYCLVEQKKWAEMKYRNGQLCMAN